MYLYRYATVYNVKYYLRPFKMFHARQLFAFLCCIWRAYILHEVVGIKTCEAIMLDAKAERSTKRSQGNTNLC